MRLGKLALLTALLAGGASAAFGQAPADYTSAVVPVSHCDCGEAVCGCEPVAACDVPMEAACDWNTGCDSGCDSGCLGGNCLDFLGCGDCCLGDPYSLFGECGPYAAGGWVQMGYHSEALPLFNSRPDEYQLHQAWLWAERSIDTSCGFDIGGRIDYVYGTDGPDTQAFGTDPRGWDNDWDHGADYGHALPQVYLEAGYGDMSVKVGHFYTIIGYEVVQAPDNFFYSHAYTMYNSEPFTHSGVLATYNATEDVTAYGGYVLGWDSGFDDNGDAFLGGLSAQLTDDLNVTYATVGGRFGEARFNGVEKGYMHSIVGQYTLSDNLAYIAQGDYLDTEDAAGLTVRETYGLNNYLLYTVNDCLSYGARFEWWNVDAESRGFYGDGLTPAQQLTVQAGATGDYDIYALTMGVNYKPHANVVVRPEIRWDWIDGNEAGLQAADISLLEDGDDDQTTFGIDTIVTF